MGAEAIDASNKKKVVAFDKCINTTAYDITISYNFSDWEATTTVWNKLVSRGRDWGSRVHEQ